MLLFSSLKPNMIKLVTQPYINVMDYFDKRIFKKKPLRVGQHVEIYKTSSKHYGKRGFLVRRVLVGRIYVQTSDGKEFYCLPSSARRTINLSEVMESNFKDKLSNKPDLYEAYRTFTELLNQYHVDPRETEFTIIIMNGMLV
jgi:hypothetical protein